MDTKIEVTINKNNDLLKNINTSIDMKTASNKDLLNELRNIQKSTNELLTELVESQKDDSHKTECEEDEDDDDEDDENYKEIINDIKVSPSKRKGEDPPNKRKTGKRRHRKQ